MFILRQIFKDGSEDNFELGSNYQFIPRGCDEYENYEDHDKDHGLIFGVLLDSDGNQYKLNIENQIYIMTEVGKTFKRLSNGI